MRQTFPSSLEVLPLPAQAQILELVASHESLPPLLTALARFVESFAPEMKCSILLADLAAGVLHHGAAPNLPVAYTRAIDGCPIEEGKGSCGTAAARRELVIVSDIAASPLWQGYAAVAAAAGLAACWSIPLIDSHGELLGTCAMYYVSAREPSAGERNLMRMVGSLAGIAIQRFRDTAVLRSNELRYRQLAQACPDAIVAHADGELMYANDAAITMLGLKPGSSIVGRNLKAFLRQDLTDIVIRHREGSLETELQTADGSFVHVEASGSRMTIDRNPATMLVMRDVTRKRVQENELLAAENRQQEHLAYDLHDGLGQQLTGISLLLGSLTGAVSEAAPAVAKEFECIRDLVSKTMSDLRTLATSMSPAIIERAGLTQALKVLRDKAEHLYGLNARVTVDLLAERQWDNATANHLFRIIQEAVGNVARHAKATQIHIAARHEKFDVVLTVEDDGIGIADEAFRGSGLGIRSMRYRAERIGATLRIERNEPRGTRVRIALPAPAPAPAPAQKEPRCKA